MTDQQPSRELAVVSDQPTREIARADTDSWIGVIGEIAKFAGYIADTDFVPRSLRGNPAACTAAVAYGREVGLPPMTSLTQTHVIEGRPSMAAEAMRALVLAAGHEIEVMESTGAVCSVRGRRRGSERWSPAVTWTIDMARAADLLGKSNWKKWPRRMLQARATSELCELYFPDVILGFRSVEEMEDEGGEEQPPSTSTVQRSQPKKRAAAKKAAAALPAPADRGEGRATPPAAGPPLPGEPGYDGQPTEQAGGATGEEQDAAPPAVDAPGSDAADDAPEASSEGAGTDPGAPEASPADAADAEEASLPVRGDGGDRAAGEASPRPISRAQQRMIMSFFGKLGISGDQDREERLLITSSIVGREVESTTKMTTAEAKTLIDTLSTVDGSREKLNLILDTIDEANAMRARAEAGDES